MLWGKKDLKIKCSIPFLFPPPQNDHKQRSTLGWCRMRVHSW